MEYKKANTSSAHRMPLTDFSFRLPSLIWTSLLLPMPQPLGPVLKKKGTSIGPGPYDLLIAGLARSRNMTLVTNNTKEFERIDNLRLENWVQV
ncbi:MAG: hypothetical protein K9K37_05730 [Desulfocapsa sp.]|nr:hypothetical protein [Desulfocapsa sp.]